MRTSRTTIHAATLTIATLLSGLAGLCVGFIFGLSVPPPLLDPSATYLWALGWTTIGSIQGACVAPAWCLGRGRAAAEPLRAWSALLCAAGALCTSVVALILWGALGQGGALSLSLGAGLLFMCAAPISAHLFARRDLSPGLPVAL